MRSERSPILGNPDRLQDYPTPTGKKNPEPTRPPTTRRGTIWRKGMIKVTMRTLQQPIISYTRFHLVKAERLPTSTLQGLSRSNLLLASLFQRSHHPPPRDSIFCHQRKPGIQKSINSCGPPCMSWSRTLKDDMQLVQQYFDTHWWAPWTLFVHLTQVVGTSISQACVTCSNPVQNCTLLWVIYVSLQFEPVFWLTQPLQRWVFWFRLPELGNMVLTHPSLEHSLGYIAYVPPILCTPAILFSFQF